MADVKTTLGTTNIKAYWDLQESSSGASGVTRYDLGPNGLNLSDNNTVTSTTGVIGNCAQFTCANSEYLSVADNANIDIDDGWTISMWLYLDSAQVGGAGDYQYIISKRSGENGIQHYVQNDAGTWYIYMGTGSGAFSSTKVNVAISTNTLYHVVFYHNGASSKVYINGSSNNVSCNAIITNAAALLIGGATDTTAWAGKIDEVLITDDEIISSEVTALYNSGAGLPYWHPDDIKNDATLSASLSVYYKLEETGASARVDSTATGYNLTATGAPPTATGIINNACDFEGTPDQLSKTSETLFPYTGAAAKSWSGWFYADSVSGVQGIWGYYNGSNPGHEWILYLNGTSLIALVGGTGAAITYTPAISTGTFYHVALVLNASNTQTMYVNGVFAGSATVTPSGGTSALTFQVGAYGHSSPTGYYNGRVDELAGWSKSLTVAEARALYGYGTPPEYEVTVAGFTPTPMMHMMQATSIL